MKILVFGAGVIGSLYAARFASAGFDTVLFARGKRLEALREKGLLYCEKGATKKNALQIIDEVTDDDVYDYILVTVRYEQVESALTALKNNKSKNIVTLTNAVQYDLWVEIAGNRLIPGFPGAGGDIKNDVLYAKFGAKNIQKTIFGEINGTVTERTRGLTRIFETAGIPSETAQNIQAFHITHAAIIIATKHFYTENGIADAQTAQSIQILKNIAADIRNNLNTIEHKGLPVTPSKMRVIKKIPAFLFVLLFSLMLKARYTRDVLLGNHARNAQGEVLLLDSDFHRLLDKKE
jgi:2-dehydropantoate 2-reductase